MYVKSFFVILVEFALCSSCRAHAPPMQESAIVTNITYCLMVVQIFYDQLLVNRVEMLFDVDEFQYVLSKSEN